MFEIVITQISYPDGTKDNETAHRIERFKMIVDDMDMGWVIKQVTATRRKRKGKVSA